MIRYRVYTENVNYDGTMMLAREMLPESFTVFKAEGFYKGQGEKSLVFEVVDTDGQQVRDFAYRVKKANRQECVLVTAETIDAFTL